MASWGHSLRASQELVIHCVMPLDKGVPFPARQALRLTDSWPAEWINITIEAHQQMLAVYRG